MFLQAQSKDESKYSNGRDPRHRPNRLQQNPGSLIAPSRAIPPNGTRIPSAHAPVKP